jgi:hypothetical protein
MGWNSMQYLLNAEIYPLRIRAISSSLVMCFHFGKPSSFLPFPRRLALIPSPVNQYGNSRAVPNMLLTLNPSGTFWFFTVITIIGGVWAWFFIPETAGRSLEQMDALFRLPWYKIGLYGTKNAVEGETVERVLAEKGEQADQVETVREEKV